MSGSTNDRMNCRELIMKDKWVAQLSFLCCIPKILCSILNWTWSAYDHHCEVNNQESANEKNISGSFSKCMLAEQYYTLYNMRKATKIDDPQHFDLI